ncbi:asparaginase [Corynebacterium sp. HS2168-gen11]|uniref:asparaginase n=1 Tax=Corynebacterium sp. HS2168-gen11 TaxID=2974027 RepID=UPI00216AD3BB|nr:asparaginase [Corynebacterium sp. HS2168-gen11]MCS4536212.1 asparaginase [Corynebacterium sp. HS2168-gen11]
MHADAAPKVVVITTGGTISCTTDASGALVPTVTGEALVAAIQPRLASTLRVEINELQQLDSSSMTFADIDDIVTACHQALADPATIGVVVTHGTDSLEETAIALDTFHHDSRPVILTGAQLPFDHPTSDGLTNLLEAITIATEPAAQDIGVLIVFGHAVLPARGALKWHTTDELAFATNGPEEPTRAEPVPVAPLAAVRVDIIPGYPGAPRTLLDAALAAGAQGLVIEGMGSGNIGTELAAAVAETLAAGIPVVISTRVPRGNVSGTYGGAGGGATLHSLGAIGSTYFRAGQARVLLAIAIATGVHPQTLF